MADTLIKKEMPIGEVVKNHPETIPVFMQHGLHCLGCAIATFESIEEGATVHGIDIEALVADLNAVAGRPGSEKDHDRRGEKTGGADEA
jgi:hybrid cluster-associated redox disulfide protein